MALSDNIWWTRKARIQAEKRLLNNNFQAQLLLLWYSFFSVGVAVYYLEFNTESQYSGVSWVVFSVLVLSISGFINGLGFKERASLIKDSYEALHGLYQRAKNTPDDTVNIASEYEQILSVCENHDDIDYHLALCETYLADSKDGLDRKPTRYVWFLTIVYRTKRLLALIALYLLPIFLFLVMEFESVCPKAV